MDDPEFSKLLDKEIAILPGSRDREGGPVLIFVNDSEVNDQTYPKVVSVLGYLSQIPEEKTRKLGFTIILDMRKATIKFLKTALKAIQQGLYGYIRQVLVVKPEQFIEKQKVGIDLLLENYDFRIVFVSLHKLSRHVDITQLPKSLGGTYSYSHQKWKPLRQKYEDFLREGSHVLRNMKAESETDSLARGSPSPLGSRSVLTEHSPRVIQFVDKGRDLLEELKDEGDDGNKSFNQDYLVAAQRVETLLRQIQEKYAVSKENMQEKVKEKDRRSLERKEHSEVLVYDKYVIGVNDLSDWLLGPGEKWLLTLHEIGESRDEAEQLCRDHEQLEQKAVELLQQNNELKSMAHSFIDQEHPKSVEIRRKQDYLDQICSAYMNRVRRQKDITVMSVRFHRLLNEFSTKLDEILENLCSEVVANDVQSAEMAAQMLDIRLEAIDKHYQEIMSAGQHFADHLSVREQNTRGHEVTRDYLAGVVHVRQCLNDLQDRKQRCSELADVRRLKLQQLVQLYTCEKDADQAIKWIEELTHTLSTQQSKIGADSNETGKLKDDQEKIEKTARSTYDYGKQLMQVSNVLRRSLRMELGKQQLLQQRLQGVWAQFCRVCSERVARLSISSAFYSTVKEVNDRLEDLCFQAEGKEAPRQNGIEKSSSQKSLTNLNHVQQQSQSAITLQAAEGGAKFEQERQQLTSEVHELRHMANALIERMSPTHSASSSRSNLHKRDGSVSAADHIREKLDIVESKQQELDRVWDSQKTLNVQPVHLSSRHSDTPVNVLELCERIQDDDPPLPPGTRRRVEHKIFIHHMSPPNTQERPSSALNDKLIMAIKKSNNWVQLRIDEMNPNILDVGNNLQEALHLQRLHNELLEKLAAKQESIEELLTQADRLVTEQPEPEAAVYEAMADSLGTAWKDLNKQLQLRSMLLNEAVLFFTAVDKHHNQLQELDMQLRAGTGPNESLDTIQRMMHQHDNMRKSLLDNASSAMQLGESIITRLRELGVMADNLERPNQTSDACNRIEQILLSLQERRKRVEIVWEDRRHQLEAGLQADNLWEELKTVEDWLNKNEGKCDKQELGNSESSAEYILQEQEQLFSEAKHMQQTAARIYYTAEQMVSAGMRNSESLSQQALALRRRLDEILDRIDVNRQLLHASSHFFRSSSSVLSQLNSLEAEIKATSSGSLGGSAENLSMSHADQSMRLREISAPTVAEGHALVDRVGRNNPNSQGVAQKLSELEQRIESLNYLCNTQREQLMKKSKQMQEFQSGFDAIHSWTMNVAESCLLTYRDMGTSLPSANDFINKHKTLASDIGVKEPDMMLLSGRIPGNPGESEYESSLKKLNDLKRRWEELKTIVDRRIQLGLVYQQFHKTAQDFFHDMENFDSMLRSGRLDADNRQILELWTNVSHHYPQMKHQGTKFISDANSVAPKDPSLEVRRAQNCVESMLDQFESRYRSSETAWTEFKQRTDRDREYKESWQHFRADCQSTFERIKRLQADAARPFGYFCELPLKVADKLNRALNEYPPEAKRVQMEIEQRLKAAEALQVPAELRVEKERLVDDLLAANHRLQATITWFEVLCAQNLTFFKNLHQLDEWNKRVDDKFSTDVLPRADTIAVDQLVREHEAARQTVAQLIRFAQTECEQILARARLSDVPSEVLKECQTLPDLISRRIKRWEEVWTKQHQILQQYSGSTKIFTDVEDLLLKVRSLNERLDFMRNQVGNSAQAAELINRDFIDYEREVNSTDQRVSFFINAVSSSSSYKTDPEIKERTESLKRNWSEFKIRLDSFKKILQAANTYFTIIEEIEMWIRETTDYVSDVGRQTQVVQSSEEANRLMEKLEMHVKPKQQMQEQRMHELQQAATVLYGHEADHKIQHIKKKYKEIIDQLVLVNDQLFGLAEQCRQTEMKRQIVKFGSMYVLNEASRSPPVFVQPLKDGQVNEGQKFEFMARVSGSPQPEITWYKDGVPIVNNPDYETVYENGMCILKIEETFTEDSAIFTCKATSSAGSAETAASLIIKESQRQKMQPPNFVVTLKNGTVQAESKYTFECQVVGDPAPVVSWFKGDECLDDRAPQYCTRYSNGSCQLIIESSVLEDEARYVCRASNPAGQAATSGSLVVIPKPKPVPMPPPDDNEKPRFTEQLRNLTVVEETIAKLDCIIVGNPEPEVIWLKEDIPVRESDRIKLMFEGDRCTLLIPNSQLHDAGLYKCVARNTMGETTSFCRLNVLPKKPLVPQQPPKVHPLLQNQVLTVGFRCMFETRVTGDPKPQVIWEHNGRRLIDSNNVQILEDSSGWHRLIINSLTDENAGTYRIQAVNPAGEATSTATLNINPSVIRPQSAAGLTSTQTHVTEEFYSNEQHLGFSPSATAPEFVRPFSQEYRMPEGTRGRLECDLLGSPRPKVQWFKDGKPINPSLGVQFTNVGNTYALIIPQVRREHAGEYTLKAQNMRGESECTCTLIVMERTSTDEHTLVAQQPMMVVHQPSAPKVDVQPPHFSKTLVSVVCTKDDEVRFDGVVSGFPAPEVVWQKDGVDLSPSAHPDLRFASAGGRVSLIFPRSALGHSGKYTCIARNAGGFATSSAQLLVRARLEAPDFEERLISREVEEGSELRWEVRITGDPKPTVTWYRNGIAIPHCDEVQMIDGVNGVYCMRIPSVELADAGQFTVRAENAAGEARSTADLVVRARGSRPGQYYHVTKVTQDVQEMGMEVQRHAQFQENEPASKVPRR